MAAFITLDFDQEAAFYGWIERSRKSSPIVRLAERLEEGSRVLVESRSGAQRDSFEARVQQVFRSGTDLWGTLLQVLSDGVESGTADAGSAGRPEVAVEDGPVEQAAPEDQVAAREAAKRAQAVADAAGQEDVAGSVSRAPEEPAVQGRGGETYGTSALFELKKLNPNQRVLLATRANRQQRRLLLRDTAQPVQMALLSNPRLESKEVLEIAKNPQTSGGVLQRLSSDQKFSTNYEVQLALVRNPQTPSPIAVRLMEVMRTGDLRYLAKSQALRENVRKAALRVYLKRSP